MTIHTETFARIKVNVDQLMPFGFQKTAEHYFYEQSILQGDFFVQVWIYADGTIKSQVYDAMAEDEYINVNIASVQGAFVASVREAYQAVLANIVQQCFTPTPFASDQGNRFAQWIQSEFNESHDTPFAKDGKHKGTGVFRNPDNDKWYALITTVSKIKLEPNLPEKAGKEIVEIINLKVDKDRIAELHKRDGIYPAYHMNKTHWVSVALDGRVDDAWLYDLATKSRAFTQKKAKKTTNKKSASKNNASTRTEPKAWVIPANPSYYDVISYFTSNDEVTWYQGANFMVGDSVYMYLGKPYSAILYACEVVAINLPTDKVNNKGKPIKRMRLKRTHSFNQADFPLSRLKALGLTSIRGARGIPDALVQALIQHQQTLN